MSEQTFLGSLDPAVNLSTFLLIFVYEAFTVNVRPREFVTFTVNTVL